MNFLFLFSYDHDYYHPVNDNQYVLLYPQRQWLLSRQEAGSEGGESEGGGFWQAIINYFGGCDGSESGQGILRNLKDNKPTMEMPDQNDKMSEKPNTLNQNIVESKPPKPFYFIIPPTHQTNY